ncbi:MAG TPA: hypothetical protein PK006_06210 [Saprospiraceae bacterium]|nr:hypothetical protein [Saprospiraceae bacterium]
MNVGSSAIEIDIYIEKDSISSLLDLQYTAIYWNLQIWPCTKLFVIILSCDTLKNICVAQIVGSNSAEWCIIVV